MFLGRQPAEHANERMQSCGPPRGEAAARATLRVAFYSASAGRYIFARFIFSTLLIASHTIGSITVR